MALNRTFTNLLFKYLFYYCFHLPPIIRHIFPIVAHSSQSSQSVLLWPFIVEKHYYMMLCYYKRVHCRVFGVNSTYTVLLLCAHTSAVVNSL